MAGGMTNTTPACLANASFDPEPFASGSASVIA
jgi:hypothetical protein